MITSLSMILFNLTALLSMFSNNWMEIWFLMELNLVSFIIFLSKKMKIENNMKYFKVQITSSLMILTCMNMEESDMKSKIFMISILVKTATFPFNSWAVSMSEKMSWMKMFFLISVQKLIPMSFFLNYKIVNMEIILIINNIFLIFMTKNVLSSKKMMIMASMNNFSWMFLFMASETMSIKFMIVYSISNIFLMKKLSMESNLMMNFNKSKESKIVEMLTLSGLPPFTMFIAKWKAIEMTMMKTSMSTSILMFISSSMMMVNYMKINLKAMFKQMMKTKKSMKMILLNIWMMLILI